MSCAGHLYQSLYEKQLLESRDEKGKKRVQTTERKSSLPYSILFSPKKRVCGSVGTHRNENV